MTALAFGNRAVLPEGQARSAADRPGTDGADQLRATLVRAVGPRPKDELYEGIAMRAFASIDLAVEDGATTLLKFRRLLVEHDLTRFDAIGISLCERVC